MCSTIPGRVCAPGASGAPFPLLPVSDLRHVCPAAPPVPASPTRLTLSRAERPTTLPYFVPGFSLLPAGEPRRRRAAGRVPNPDLFFEFTNGTCGPCPSAAPARDYKHLIPETLVRDCLYRSARGSSWSRSACSIHRFLDPLMAWRRYLYASALFEGGARQCSGRVARIQTTSTGLLERAPPGESLFLRRCLVACRTLFDCLLRVLTISPRSYRRSLLCLHL